MRVACKKCASDAAALISSAGRGSGGVMWGRIRGAAALIVLLCASTMVVAGGSSAGADDAARFGVQALVPARLADTRPGATTVDGQGTPGAPIGQSGELQVTVSGRGGVPTSGVGAVILNVTVTEPTD